MFFPAKILCWDPLKTNCTAFSISPSPLTINANHALNRNSLSGNSPDAFKCITTVRHMTSLWTHHRMNKGCYTTPPCTKSHLEGSQTQSSRWPRALLCLWDRIEVNTRSHSSVLVDTCYWAARGWLPFWRGRGVKEGSKSIRSWGPLWFSGCWSPRYRASVSLVTVKGSQHR